MSRGAKPRYARFLFHRPLLGRWSLSAVKRLRVLAEHGPDSLLPRTLGSHSARLPAGCTRDLESRGRVSSAIAAPLAAIDTGPDFGAFGAGVELMVFTALFAIAALVVLNWILKTMRSSK